MSAADNTITQFEQELSERLIAETANNHREWMILTTAANEGEIVSEESAAYTLNGSNGEAMILFPKLDDRNAGAVLDRICSYYYDRKPESLVGCWSIDPPTPVNLGIKLLARGFQPGWRPCWMGINLEDTITEHTKPKGLKIILDSCDNEWKSDGLPYFYDGLHRTIRAASRLAPNRVFHATAFQDGEVVGHCILYISEANPRYAGLYSVGVLESARNRGIGKAMVASVCEKAKSYGCEYVLLNATGKKMYQQIGFQHLGDGWTWWLNVPKLYQYPVSRSKTEIAEAACSSNISQLSQLIDNIDIEDLNWPLPNGMNLVQLAIFTGNCENALILHEYGAAMDPISAWECGWKDMAIDLLSESPETVNMQNGEMMLTPMHRAVEKKDAELVKILLGYHPDLNLKDCVFHSTPLGWAKHFQMDEITMLLENAR